GYFAEAGSFLWIILLSFTLQTMDAATFVGYWNLAVSLISAFLIATTMARPIFPAISEAYIKEQKELVQQYCNKAANWFFLWAFFALGIYIAFGEHILMFISGENWKISGQIIRVIAPATFIKFGNEYLIGILNAMGKPKKVMIGTALKIPVMVGLFVLIGAISITIPGYGYIITTENFGFYASVYFLMELVFCIYLLRQIKGTVKLKIPKHFWIIPACACIIAIFIPAWIFWRVDRSNLGLVLMLVLYVVFYSWSYQWLGGIDDEDFVDLEDSLKNFMFNKLAEILVKIARWFAKLSPLYGKFSSKENNLK
ncbi:MAG: lipopolysaccharide biosynthesis protein, partial [Promethearchaeota archaeon]